MSTHTDPVARRMTAANPAPADAEPPAEVLNASVLLDLIDERSWDMTTTTKKRERRPIARRPRPRRAAWALAGGFILVILAVGAVIFLGGGDSPDVAGEPSVTTIANEGSPEPTEAPQVTAPVAPETPEPTAPPATTAGSPTTSPAASASTGSWTTVSDLEVFGDNVISDVVAFGSGFVSVGQQPGILSHPTGWISEDGREWTQVTDLALDENVLGISLSRFDGGLVLLGHGFNDGMSYTAAASVSVDGLSWIGVPDDAPILDGGLIAHLSAGGPGLVAIHEDGTVFTSPDGLAWVRVSGDTDPFGGGRVHDLGAGGPGLVAVGSVDGDGNDAAVWTSTDAVTWNRATGTDLGGPGNQWMDAVTSGPLGLVAVGSSSTDEGGSTGAVWTSADGLSWTRVPNDEAAFAAVLADTGESTMNLFDVVAGGPGYVAVGAEAVTDQSVVLVSVDGQTWSRQSPSEIDIWVSSITVEAGPAGVLVVGARDGNPTGTGAPIDMWILAP